MPVDYGPIAAKAMLNICQVIILACSQPLPQTSDLLFSEQQLGVIQDTCGQLASSGSAATALRITRLLANKQQQLVRQMPHLHLQQPLAALADLIAQQPSHRVVHAKEAGRVREGGVTDLAQAKVDGARPAGHPGDLPSKQFKVTKHPFSVVLPGKPGVERKHRCGEVEIRYNEGDVYTPNWRQRGNGSVQADYSPLPPEVAVQHPVQQSLQQQSPDHQQTERHLQQPTQSAHHHQHLDASSSQRSGLMGFAKSVCSALTGHALTKSTKQTGHRTTPPPQHRSASSACNRQPAGSGATKRPLPQTKQQPTGHTSAKQNAWSAGSCTAGSIGATAASSNATAALQPTSAGRSHSQATDSSGSASYAAVVHAPKVAPASPLKPSAAPRSAGTQPQSTVATGPQTGLSVVGSSVPAGPSRAELSPKPANVSANNRQDTAPVGHGALQPFVGQGSRSNRVSADRGQSQAHRPGSSMPSAAGISAEVAESAVAKPRSHPVIQQESSARHHVLHGLSGGIGNGDGVNYGQSQRSEVLNQREASKSSANKASSSPTHAGYSATIVHVTPEGHSYPFLPIPSAQQQQQQSQVVVQQQRGQQQGHPQAEPQQLQIQLPPASAHQSVIASSQQASQATGEHQWLQHLQHTADSSQLYARAPEELQYMVYKLRQLQSLHHSFRVAAMTVHPGAQFGYQLVALKQRIQTLELEFGQDFQDLLARSRDALAMPEAMQMDSGTLLDAVDVQDMIVT
ncbi:TPA: hypothetical protein ACH3X2_002293 [Trebouxia sp. C0005]